MIAQVEACRKKPVLVVSNGLFDIAVILCRPLGRWFVTLLPKQPSHQQWITGLVPASAVTLRSITSVNQSRMNESRVRILYACPILGIAFSPVAGVSSEARNANWRLGTMKTSSRSRAFNRVVIILWDHMTVTHGWSGHVRFNVPDVPGLRDSSAIIGDLYELNNAIVIFELSSLGPSRG